MRYRTGNVRKPRADWYDDDSPLVPSLNVDSHQEVDTGLIAVTGEPIYRVPNPIGFGRDGEW
jgi:hypothetical protein